MAGGVHGGRCEGLLRRHDRQGRGAAGLAFRHGPWCSLQTGLPPSLCRWCLCVTVRGRLLALLLLPVCSPPLLSIPLRTPPFPPHPVPPQALAAALKRHQLEPAAAASPPAPCSPADATLVLAPEECLLHMTEAEPLRCNSRPHPENVERLRVLTNPGEYGGRGGGG